MLQVPFLVYTRNKRDRLFARSERPLHRYIHDILAVGCADTDFPRLRSKLEAKAGRPRKLPVRKEARRHWVLAGYEQGAGMWARRLSPKLFRMTRAAGLCADISTILGVRILGVCG